MKVVDGREQDYKEWRNNNSDPYGTAIFTYAERWAEMLESLIDKNSDVEKVIAENAEKTSREADTEGITGFMYGEAVGILALAWKYGDYLRKWHNSKYNHDGDGVVNPAILHIK